MITTRHLVKRELYRAAGWTFISTLLVAPALVHRPPVIILAEPTAGVAADLRRTLWDFITRLNQAGHTILLTTHYLEEAESLCGRVAMLKSGQVVALDTTQALMARVGGADLEDAFVRIMHDDSVLEAEL